VLKHHYGIAISTSGYYSFKTRPVSARSLRDERLKELIFDLWEENLSCWGVRKLWRELLRKEHVVARCTVARLMGELGIEGRSRAKVKRTTIAGDTAHDAEDLVQRVFYAPEPNKLWVADFTYVSTWEGWCYTAFVTDVYARKILGWAVSARMNKKLVIGAFVMAVNTRQREGYIDFSDLIHQRQRIPIHFRWLRRTACTLWDQSIDRISRRFL
jgi:putative transposase